ncbi:MAG: NifB/NifX family molybdenum-iron cluster-binding protein [Desulfobacterales bacterium]|jgi:predicted Fe-Mo cluster-binding NifX family protein
MKICIPTETDQGLEATVTAHFGSAPFFTIYDTDTKILEHIGNRNLRHMHGGCQPLLALNGEAADVVICGGMGARAVQKLAGGGIKAYKVKGATVNEALTNYVEGRLNQITPLNACQDHDFH